MYKDVFEKLLNRVLDSHKYQFGHVLVMGGAPGMVGAPLLAAQAALRTGAGLVTLASDEAVIEKLEGRVAELLTLVVPPKDAIAMVKGFILERKVSTIVVGPGMSSQSAGFIRELIQSTDLPMVIDGGAIGALQDHLQTLERAPSKQIVLTPHLGEFRKIYTEELPKERPALQLIVKAFSQQYEATLVLKGKPTYVAHPDGSLYENPTGNPGLATAGAGDVLSGVIAGIIAQGIELAPTVDAAVFLHGLAGDIAVQAKTQPGMIASDIIEAIPEAFKAIAYNGL